MKILITGGCGFLGSNIARRVLKQDKAELYILDSLCRAGSGYNLKWLKKAGKFKFFRTSVCLKKNVENIVKRVKPDIVFHLAGQVAMTISVKDPALDFETNAAGTLNMLESVRNYSPESVFIYSSTNKVYGSLDWVKYKETDKRYIAEDFPNGFSENTPLDFYSPYGCSKGTADQYVLDYSRTFGLKTVVFRHSSMYGDRQFSTYDQGWIAWFCQKAIEAKRGLLKRPFTISGNGKQVRDVLFADDMVDLYFKCAEDINHIKGNAFNIGGGASNSLSLLELFDILEKRLNVKLEYERIPWRHGDQKVFIADISKINKMCGWRPEVDKFTGINRMLEWLEQWAG